MTMKSLNLVAQMVFNLFSFKKYWDIIKKDLWRLVRGAFVNGFYEASIVEVLIALILKIYHPKQFKGFKPISLCNVTHKIITKVLVHRLRPFLEEIISPLQGIFCLRGAQLTMLLLLRSSSIL